MIFKVGDEVIVTKGDILQDAKIGDIGIVLKVEISYSPFTSASYFVSLPNNSWAYMLDHELELSIAGTNERKLKKALEID